MSNESARTFPDAIVTAKCVDCELEFTGPLGVRFIDDRRSSPCIEIVVEDSKRNQIHAIARVDIYLVPVAHETIAPLPPMGSA